MREDQRRLHGGRELDPALRSQKPTESRRWLLPSPTRPLQAGAGATAGLEPDFAQLRVSLHNYATADKSEKLDVGNVRVRIPFGETVQPLLFFSSFKRKVTPAGVELTHCVRPFPPVSLTLSVEQNEDRHHELGPALPRGFQQGRATFVIVRLEIICADDGEPDLDATQIEVTGGYKRGGRAGLTVGGGNRKRTAQDAPS